ncbi:MAG: lipopolysaccharide heptosyltransferase II [Deltaproteobacteria bacterium]|jgi:heptosyltransferase-2|nr:lipopolysaccharide heptosyltransferase II [Deltaproteobacteria bacterium]
MDNAISHHALLARGLNWLGDAVISIPAIRALALARPEGVAVVARGGARELYRALPGVTEVWDDKKSPRDRYRLIRELKKRRFGEAILFPNSFGAALLAFLARIPVRIGYAGDGRSLLLTEAVAKNRAALGAHEAFSYLSLLETAGIPAPFVLPSLARPEAAKGRESGEFRLALAPGASYGTAKRFGAKGFAKTARLYAEIFPRAQITLVGAAAEIGEAQAALALLRASGLTPLDLTGKTTFAELVRVLAEASLVLCNDSGVMHLAAALRTPVAVPFGPTNPLATGPLSRESRILRVGAECSPCKYRHCPKPEKLCYRGLEPESLFRESRALLKFLSLPRDPARSLILSFVAPPRETAIAPDAPLAFVLDAVALASIPPSRLAPGPDQGTRPDAFPLGTDSLKPKPRAYFQGKYPLFQAPDARRARLWGAEMALSRGFTPQNSVFLANSLAALREIKDLPKTLPDARPSPARDAALAPWPVALVLNADEPSLARQAARENLIPTVCAPSFARALEWAQSYLK